MPVTRNTLVHGTPVDLEAVELIILNLEYESSRHLPGFWIARAGSGISPGVVVEWWLITPPVLLAGLWPLSRAIYQYAKSRRGRGVRHCPKCDYNLTGLPSSRCPECGADFVVN